MSAFFLLTLWLQADEWQKSSAAEALYTKKDIGGHEVEFLKPQTFMNNSGLSVAFASKKHELKPEQVIVVCDDIDLPFGKIRIAKSRGSGGHNGLALDRTTPRHERLCSCTNRCFKNR
jgi:peptidyl-tRNA hydrolase